MMESRFQPVILASQSPRRKELLARIFSDFQVCPAHADESLTPGFTPKQNVACLAQRKAQAVAQHSDCQALIIASDTIVGCDDVILGKPENEADAVRMLRQLSGRTHQVMTAVCVKTPERELTQVASWDCRFACCMRCCGRSAAMPVRKNRKVDRSCEKIGKPWFIPDGFPLR